MPNRYLFQNLDSWFLILLLCIVPWEQFNNRNIHPPSGSHLSCALGNIIFIFENYHISAFPVTQISRDDVQYFNIDVDIITYNYQLQYVVTPANSQTALALDILLMENLVTGDIYDIICWPWSVPSYQVFWGQRARWNQKNVVDSWHSSH